MNVTRRIRSPLADYRRTVHRRHRSVPETPMIERVFCRVENKAARAAARFHFVNLAIIQPVRLSEGQLSFHISAFVLIKKSHAILERRSAPSMARGFLYLTGGSKWRASKLAQLGISKRARHP